MSRTRSRGRCGTLAFAVTMFAIAAAATPGVVAAATGPVPIVGSCAPTAPNTCTLADLGTLSGRRIGATLEPGEIADPAYASTLIRHFDAVTPENAMKWYSIRPTPGSWSFAGADAVVDFAAQHGLSVRGHNLVWAQDTFTPTWVRALSDTALRSEMNAQITTVMTRYSGRVHRYDVVNEPLQTLGTSASNSVFWKLGPTWIHDAFVTAHAADQSAELWLNEYGSDWVPGKHAALLELVRGLLATGTPIDGIGIQTHGVPGIPFDPTSFAAQLRDFADLGLRVAITELDVPTSPTDPSAFAHQAQEYAAVAWACATVDACEEITTWGLTDASTWLDHSSPWPTPTRPLLFDDAFQPKPAYDAVRVALANAATDEAAHPHVRIPTAWTAEEYARIRSIASTLGVTPSHVQRLATYLSGYLAGMLGPNPLPVSLPTAGTAVATTNRWASAELPVVDAVASHFVLDRTGSVRFSVYLLSYLLALAGR